MRKIKVGDSVKILSGKEKGKTGEVVKLMPKTNKAVVKGINIVVKHKKKSLNQEAARIKVEAPINVSKLMLIDPSSGKTTRVGFNVDKSGKKERISKKTKKSLK